MAGLHAMHSTLDIVEVAQTVGTTPERVAKTYFMLGEELGLHWLRDQVERLGVSGRWQAMARNSMRENLYHLQGQLARQALEEAGPRRSPESAITSWSEARGKRLTHVQEILNEMRGIGGLDFPTLSVSIQEVRRLSQS
jgi:glutamate dehydrogenase